MIIYNNEPGIVFGTLGTGTAPAIPAIGISEADGDLILSSLQPGTTTASVSVGATASDYATFSGTSMSAPHVAGIAALTWAARPQCSAASVRAALDSSAMDLGASGRDSSFGFGLVQALVAKAALLASGGPCPTSPCPLSLSGATCTESDDCSGSCEKRNQRHKTGVCT